jgi:hypothetical protein
MSLDMFLEILGALECFATEVTLMGLQGNMHADVRSDVVALDGCRAAVAPLAGQIEVVSALAADMALTDVVLGEG